MLSQLISMLNFANSILLKQSLVFHAQMLNADKNHLDQSLIDVVQPLKNENDTSTLLPHYIHIHIRPPKKACDGLSSSSFLVVHCKRRDHLRRMKGDESSL